MGTQNVHKYVVNGTSNFLVITCPQSALVQVTFIHNNTVFFYMEAFFLSYTIHTVKAVVRGNVGLRDLHKDKKSFHN